jgi:DNA-binding IclR family transcriptional regulator
MREVGFLDQDRTRDRYRLGLKLFEFGNIVLSNMDLHREARPYVEQLGRLTGQLVHLAVFDGRQAVVIHRSDPSDSATPLTYIENAPVHCTSVGKAVLAFQPPMVIDRLIAAGLADRQTNPDNRRETLLQLTEEGRRTVEDVTVRRRAEIAAIVERLAPRQRVALVEALTAFNEAGGEPLAPAMDDPEPHPLGWVDAAEERDA